MSTAQIAHQYRIQNVRIAGVEPAEKLGAYVYMYYETYRAVMLAPRFFDFKFIL